LAFAWGPLCRARGSGTQRWVRHPGAAHLRCCRPYPCPPRPSPPPSCAAAPPPWPWWTGWRWAAWPSARGRARNGRGKEGWGEGKRARRGGGNPLSDRVYWHPAVTRVSHRQAAVQPACPPARRSNGVKCCMWRGCEQATGVARSGPHRLLDLLCERRRVGEGGGLAGAREGHPGGGAPQARQGRRMRAMPRASQAASTTPRRPLRPVRAALVRLGQSATRLP
jgi:hypothetical protein